MRVFVTGATGFIGLAVVKELVGAGHEVTGLVRSEKSAAVLRDLGARAQIGSIEDLELLRKTAANAEGAVHTAFFHAIGQMGFGSRLRVLLGGLPTGIVSRFTAVAVEADRRAIQTIGNALAGTDRAMVAAFPTMALAPARLATEEDRPEPKSVGGGRAPSEEATLALAAMGVRASVVRLPPMVHDENKQGLASMLAKIAANKGVSAYVGDGGNRWGAVHRLDAARLFRLALENGVAGSRYHAVAEEGVRLRQIAEAIGNREGVPTESRPPKEAAKLFGWLSGFVEADNPVSSRLTREQLRWTPSHAGILADLGR